VAEVKRHCYEDIVVYIHGMTCMSCVRSIEGNMVAVSGLKFIKVFLDKKEAYVKYDPDLVTPEVIRQNIEDMGFQASLTMPDDLDQVKIGIKGMTCQSCVNNIEGVIVERSGVRDIKVSLEKCEAVIKYNIHKTSPLELRCAVEDLGYDAFWDYLDRPNEQSNNDIMSCSITIEGMTCHSCVRNIEASIGKQTGVKRISVSLENKEAMISYDPSVTSPDVLREQIEDMGYDALLKSDSCTIDIDGMTCQSCVQNIESQMSATLGISYIKVSLECSKADIGFKPDLITAQMIADRIVDMGYDAKVTTHRGTDPSALMHSTINIKGIHSNSCTRTIESKLSTVKGVARVEVSLLSETADVWYDGDQVRTKELCNAVEAAGEFNAYLEGENLDFFSKI